MKEEDKEVSTKAILDLAQASETFLKVAITAKVNKYAELETEALESSRHMLKLLKELGLK